MIYSDYSLHPREVSQTHEEKVVLLERLRVLRDAFSATTTIGAGGFREIVRSTRLFDSHMDLAEKFIAEERSEEHTSELQSLMRISYAVFCLKKKKHKNITKIHYNN